MRAAMQTSAIMKGGWVVLAVLLVLASGVLTYTYTDAFESLELSLAPSASRAYEMGSRHFNSRDAAHYDIVRAVELYSQALAIDPQYPYARHQLARIAFLRGDFSKALRLIDAELALSPEPATPSSHYVKGLILGYVGRFPESAIEYEKYLSSDPTNWAAINDYAWVLISDGKARKAVDVTLKGLNVHPDNPWLLNSSAIALYEIGLRDAAEEQSKKAMYSIMTRTEQDWLQAYPGNDPLVALEGLHAFQDSLIHNMKKMRISPEMAGYTGGEE